MRLSTRILIPFALAAALPIHASTILDAWYHLGEADLGALAGNPGNATTMDSSGHGFNLARTGNALYSGNSVSTLSMLFQGNGFYSGGTVTSATDNFGIQAWIDPAAGAGNSVIAYDGNTSTSGFGLYYYGGGEVTFLYGGNFMLPFGSAPTIPTGVWSAVAVVRNGGVTTLYINGVPVYSDGSGPNPAAGSMMIGGNINGLEQFSGMIDEVQVFHFNPGQFNANTDLFAPEPGSIALAASGALLFWAIRRRRAA